MGNRDFLVSLHNALNVEKPHCILFLCFSSEKDLGRNLLLVYSNIGNGMATDFSKKSRDDFYCEVCDVSMVSNKDYVRHLSTRKHISNTSATDFSNPKHICEICNKTYNDRSGLWRHKKKCKPLPVLQNEFRPHPPSSSSFMITPEFILEVIKQNHEQMQEIRKEDNKMFLELVQKVNSVANSNNTTNSHNKAFNINVFLNEHCKDAVNLTDFVDAFKVTVQDLERTGRIGFVGGMTQLILEGMKELDIHHRPIHCTDLKRETVYVKDEGKWVKDVKEEDGSRSSTSREDLPRFRTAIKKIATKNLQQLGVWIRENPECEDPDSEESEIALKLSKHIMGGIGKDEEKKFENSIMRNVMKTVTVEKDTVTISKE